MIVKAEGFEVNFDTLIAEADFGIYYSRRILQCSVVQLTSLRVKTLRKFTFKIK